MGLEEEEEDEKRELLQPSVTLYSSLMDLKLFLLIQSLSCLGNFSELQGLMGFDWIPMSRWFFPVKNPSWVSNFMI